MYYITEFICGGLITAAFSYGASYYESYPEYIKIIAFLWGMPILYFYILYVSWKTSKQAAIDVTKHGLYGILTTIFAMLFTLSIHSFSKFSIISFNIIFLLFVMFIYLYNELYKTI
jgi:hypothetical protein